jgi:hypothetical protein
MIRLGRAINLGMEKDNMARVTKKKARSIRRGKTRAKRTVAKQSSAARRKKALNGRRRGTIQRPAKGRRKVA